MNHPLHASCVEKNGQGILLRGPAGSGKSSFALSLINRGFNLVGDDQIVLVKQANRLIAKPAEALKGLLEVRGLGIIELTFSDSCEIAYVIDLVPCSERMPENRHVEIDGPPIRAFSIDPQDPWAVEKVFILLHSNFQGFYEESHIPHFALAGEK